MIVEPGIQVIFTLVGQLPGRLNFGGNVAQRKVTLLFPSKKNGSGRGRGGRDHASNMQ
jgi:hypothetical protein